MRKFVFSLLYFASIFCAIFASARLFLVLWVLCLTHGTYSYEENGAIICGVPIFTADNWLWTSLELFIVPGLILGAAVSTAKRCYSLKSQ